jgi:peptidoglycan hydrolase-like protein with peptidoglycan-binding domain
MTKKIYSVFISLAMAGTIVVPLVASATNTSTQQTSQQLLTTLKAQIASLQTQIADLNTQLESLKKAQGEVKETTQDVKGTLKLLNQLKPGMTSDEVKTLQEIMATDSDVYPEGIISGHYGKLTEKAVKKFQKKLCLDQVGNVGPKTLSKINELLTEGAGSSGKVPPGLLKAPGIQKKLCTATTPNITPCPQVVVCGQNPTTGEITQFPSSCGVVPNGLTSVACDFTAPIISNIQESNITASGAKITWTTNESAKSKIWYGSTTPVSITGNPTQSSSAYVSNHEMMLTSLTASSTYYYIVGSSDSSGNTATSTEDSFTTLAQ